ncbi:DUF1624 domain-containing protein [Rubrobacter marinus]|uniref:DUF1624 domain-containing protein n=1 Tax=Rubrobacter marinus TaxID=2653852 RepID=A0A6G8PVZ8_9ACTN|nr:DUF1624 domain-containing protein [Rubrobacter marinus]
MDFARGLAMVAVIFYHLVYDLDVLGGFPIESTSGFWGTFADASAFAFVFLAGLSLSLSSARAGRAGEDRGPFGKYLRRGSRIFSYGLLVTVVFWVFDLGVVVFGILHLIGASIVLAYPFLRLRLANLLAGVALVAVGVYLRAKGVDAAGTLGILLAPLGVDPEGFYMPDYRPLLPWFGVVLLGLFFGNVAYRQRGADAESSDAPLFAAPLAFLGRHTLLVYLIHQPILIAVLRVTGAIELGF